MENIYLYDDDDYDYDYDYDYDKFNVSLEDRDFLFDFFRVIYIRTE